MREAYYSFDWGNVHFVALDSLASDRSPGGPMLSWLAADLAATEQDWVIAYFYHPPYSKGRGDSDDPTAMGGRLREMRENALPVLETGGADLVLASASRAYERSYLIDSHYGASDSLEGSMVVDPGDGRFPGDGPYARPTPGIAPHGVKEKYYWVARPGQPYNRVVDIGAHIDTKVASMSVNKSQGPAGSQGSRLKTRLAEQGLRLPILGGDDEQADREFIKLFGLHAYRELGQKYGFEYAESFYHIPPTFRFIGTVDPDEIQTYIDENAAPVE